VSDRASQSKVPIMEGDGVNLGEGFKAR
jgi:hypothetical protein